MFNFSLQDLVHLQAEGDEIKERHQLHTALMLMQIFLGIQLKVTG